LNANDKAFEGSEMLGIMESASSCNEFKTLQHILYKGTIKTPKHHIKHVINPERAMRPPGQK
jgi:hypothetical protein